MATNLPLTGNFNVTCEYKRQGTEWIAGWHTGIDMTGSDTIYGTCDGTVTRIGTNDKDYGNFIVVKAPDGKYHWFCHLSRIDVEVNQNIDRLTKLGVMGATGNVTGKHLHFEIRNASNKYADNSNPADYMGIPNKVGSYNSENYQIDSTNNNTGEMKTLAKNTNLRNEPTTSSSEKTLYIPNTTLYVLQASVAQADGYTWDKVRIRVNGKEGYMINKNYK